MNLEERIAKELAGIRSDLADIRAAVMGDDPNRSLAIRIALLERSAGFWRRIGQQAIAAILGGSVVAFVAMLLK